LGCNKKIGGDKLIIAKTTSGKYVTQYGLRIKFKEDWLEEKKQVEAITQPTDKELIEIGKQTHEFYRKDLMLENIDNNIKEIDDYEKTKDKIIIDDSKKE
jgi:hypothetical protein